MLTGKQRSYLKALATDLKETVYIGKNELTEETLKEMDDYLRVHEMVKVKIQDNAMADAKETANIAAAELKAEFVQAIGRKFVLYRRSKDNPVIELPKAPKK